jgi:dienelactone hydrolase
LDNAGGWNAEPIMVSGTDAYVDGEYLYQDFIFDDHGANTADAPLPPSPRIGGGGGAALGAGVTTGDVVYPTDEGTFHYNAADILEIRARPVSEGVAYRITLNTMVDPGVAGIAIGIDTDRNASSGSDRWGYGIGTLGKLGLEHVLVTWGNEAELDGRSVPSTVDVERNQIEVTIPLEPDEETWRHYAVSGLFDPEQKEFRQVREIPDETHPGGAHGQDPPPLFNVAFRFDEPLPSIAHVEPGTVEKQVEELIEGGSIWRDHAQANGLSNRDISQFHGDIDFAKLSSRTTEYHVPETGHTNRLFASRYNLGHGLSSSSERFVRFLGRIQPYALYVPENHREDERTPLHLNFTTGLHNYDAAWTPNLIRELGEQRNAIVLMPAGRSVGVPYRDDAELDVFEAFAAVKNQYDIDMDRVTISGYSIGGHATLKLTSQYPDLFAKGFSIAGAPRNTPLLEEIEQFNFHDAKRITDNLRNVPLLMWNGSNDERVPPQKPIRYSQQLANHGYRHELDLFTGYDHFLFFLRDQWGPAREYLDGATVRREPPHITYRAVPEFDNDQFDLIHNKSHWISDIGVAEEASSGLVDVRSNAFGEAPPVEAMIKETGTDPAPHIKRGVRWKESLQNLPPQNSMDLDLEDVRTLTIWVEEAQLDPAEPITLVVNSTIPTTIVLASSTTKKEIHLPAGHSERNVQLHRQEPTMKVD